MQWSFVYLYSSRKRFRDLVEQWHRQVRFCGECLKRRTAIIVSLRLKLPLSEQAHYWVGSECRVFHFNLSSFKFTRVCLRYLGLSLRVFLISLTRKFGFLILIIRCIREELLYTWPILDHLCDGSNPLIFKVSGKVWHLVWEIIAGVRRQCSEVILLMRLRKYECWHRWWSFKLGPYRWFWRWLTKVWTNHSRLIHGAASFLRHFLISEYTRHW